MGEHDEFIADFLEECDENLDQLDQELVALEENPHDESRLRSIFRNVHTIKGSSGFFGFAKLGALAHEGETLLGKLRDGELIFNQAIASGLLAMSDAIREILVSLEQSGIEGEKDYGDVADALIALLSPTQTVDGDDGRVGVSDEAASAGDTEAKESPSGSADGVDSTSHIESDVELASQSVARESKLSEHPSDEVGDLDSQTQVNRSFIEDSDKSDANLNAEQVRHGDRQVGTKRLDSEAESPLESNVADGKGRNAVDGAEVAKAEPTSIRVDVGLLDELMDFAGELVLARNSLTRCSEFVSDSRLTLVANRVSQITSDIQDRVTRTRMQPIGVIWGRFRRIVRDLALSCGKQVRLELIGEETELDRSLLEAIRDPLTHLIRNGVDHGIEGPNDRMTAGKPAEGVIRLNARHESGQVVIEATDDGAGIDVDKVREKAISRRLLDSDTAAKASAEQLLQLIFEPGFSTASQVSEISGRGVGMDVVRSHVEQIGGSVHVKSVVGSGTTLTIKLPLTLAILPALAVRSGNQQFVLPQASLLEVVTIGESSPIEWLHDVPVYRLRGKLLPLVWMDQVLGISSGAASSDGDRQNGRKQSKKHVAVLKVDQLKYGLVIDEVLSSQEIVVKPIGASIKAIGAYSAATIMGDGSVALILDLGGVAKLAGLTAAFQGQLQDSIDAERAVSDHSLSGMLGEPKARSSSRSVPEDQSLLICEIGGGREVGIQMRYVERLEEIARSKIQVFDGGLATNYRGQILPVRPFFEPQYRFDVTNDETLGFDEQKSQVVVCNKDGGRVGIVVQSVADVATTYEESTEVSLREGEMAGHGLTERLVIVQGRIIEMLDLDKQFVEATQGAG